MHRYSNTEFSQGSLFLDEDLFDRSLSKVDGCFDHFVDWTPIKIISDATEMPQMAANASYSVNCQPSNSCDIGNLGCQSSFDFQCFEFERNTMTTPSTFTNFVPLNRIPDNNSKMFDLTPDLFTNSEISFTEMISSSPTKDDSQSISSSASSAKDSVSSLDESSSSSDVDAPSQQTQQKWTDTFSCLGNDYKPSGWDVICGRGRHSYNHIGNLRFRVMIANKLNQYIEAKTKRERSQVVNSIFAHIVGSSGIFVKQDEKGNWYNIGTKLSRDKIAHTFRDSMKGPLRRRKYSSTKENRRKLIQAQDSILESCKITIQQHRRRSACSA